MMVGVANLSICMDEFKEILERRLTLLYQRLENHITCFPAFGCSFQPIQTKTKVPFIQEMIRFTKEAETGPMASVAGAFSDEIRKTADKYAKEAFVENGGDISLRNRNPVSVMIYPGWGAFSTEVSLEIPPGSWGVASSSGRFGHSFSSGKAEMVSVVDHSATRADAFATSICNQVTPGCDPLRILDRYNFLKAAVIIWKEKIWYKGAFNLFFH